VLGLIAVGGYLAFSGNGLTKPLSPVVVLPPEPIWPGANILPAIPGLLPDPTPLSNTFLATLIADVVLLAFAFGAWRFSRSGNLVPRGLYNFFEWIVEFLWNMTESAAGKWAGRMFPIVATIFLLVFTANMIKLVPGFETIGWMKEAHEHGYQAVPLFGNIYALDANHPVEQSAAGEHNEGEAATAEGAAGEEFCAEACEVVPFLRGSATDVNFTFALAVTSFVMIQVFGVWALGAKYFQKFINVSTMISKPLFGVIDFGVGLLELISEFAKILSFGFRLFGNIFAGALLLSILGALTAIIVPSALYGLEFFVGIIQAYVFAMLTLTFMSQAVVSHHGDDHAEHAAH
jgi:F-type H+-transporting ATPase subunit a